MKHLCNVPENGIMVTNFLYRIQLKREKTPVPIQEFFKGHAR